MRVLKRLQADSVYLNPEPGIPNPLVAGILDIIVANVAFIMERFRRFFDVA
jgi:hypothetical protein